MTPANVAAVRDKLKRGIFVPPADLIAVCDAMLALVVDLKRVQQENQRLASPPLF